MAEVIGKNLGKLPVYCGEWGTSHPSGYMLHNKVAYLGSLFISTMNNNTNEPVSLIRDSSGYLIDYTLNQGWEFAANALDASVEATHEILLCRETREECFDDVSTLLYDTSILRDDVDYIYKHVVVLSETEYESLEHKDASTFYYMYEED